MKRFLLAAVLLVAPIAAFAQALDRDVLLAPNGTLFAAEAVTVGADSWGAAPSKYLRITSQNGDTTTQTIVAETKQNGINTRPSLAYDSQTNTLFIFWIHMPTAMTSDIVVAALRDGKMTPAVVIDDSGYHYRSNLSLGITRRVAQTQQDGSSVDVAALLVHAVWWEETGSGGEARYALMSIDKGRLDLVDSTSVPLNLYVPADNEIAPVKEKFNREILKHPAVLDNGSDDSVDVVFGNTSTNIFNRVTLKPHAEARIRIPIGAKPGPRLSAPEAFTAQWTGPVNTMSSRNGSTLVFANTGKDAVNYIMFSNGQWSDVKSISTGAAISTDAAMTALAKMVNIASE
jgi:hypothetical protein